MNKNQCKNLQHSFTSTSNVNMLGYFSYSPQHTKYKYFLMIFMIVERTCYILCAINLSLLCVKTIDVICNLNNFKFSGF